MTAFNPNSIFAAVGDEVDITISPTQIAKAQVCFRQLGYYRARVKPAATPLNLMFGVALHWAIEGYLKGYLKAEELEDMFSHHLNKLRVGQLISMSKTKSVEVAEVIGKQLVKSFPAYFESLGVQPLIIEGEFKIQIGPKTFITVVIDFVGVATRPIYDRDNKLVADVGDTVILDWKTAAKPEGHLFARYGLQLSFYWLAVQLAAKQLGIKPPKACGYAAGLKPNVSNPNSTSIGNAVWMPVHWVKRSAADIEEALAFAMFVVRRIRNGEYFREPGMAYNSPCDSGAVSCDVAPVCLEGSLEGLVVPAAYQLSDLI